MPKQFRKTLQKYVSKMKKPSKKLYLPTKKLASSTTNWVLRGCKHPKTLSFSHDRDDAEEIDHQPSNGATLSAVDDFLFENFRSLYQNEYDEKLRNNVENNNNKNNNGVVLFEPPPRTPRTFLDSPPKFPSTSRFFIERSVSSSLIDEARTSLTTSNLALDDSKRSTYYDEEEENNNNNNNNNSNNNTKNSDDFITLLAHTANPYDDFKKSMNEMIEARINFHGKVDWEFMEELLFCYLDMNDKKSYKFILRAFVDLNVGLRENSGKVQGKSRNVQATSVRRRKLEF